MNEGLIFDDFFNRHFIRTNEHSHITHGFSDGFEQPQDGDILINAQGGYQFRLFPGGEENPQLHDDNGIPLYRWDGGQAILRTQEDRQAEFDARPVHRQPDPMQFALGMMTALQEGDMAAVSAFGVTTAADASPVKISDYERGANLVRGILKLGVAK